MQGDWPPEDHATIGANETWSKRETATRSATGHWSRSGHRPRAGRRGWLHRALSARFVPRWSLPPRDPRATAQRSEAAPRAERVACAECRTRSRPPRGLVSRGGVLRRHVVDRDPCRHQERTSLHVVIGRLAHAASDVQPHHVEAPVRRHVSIIRPTYGRSFWRLRHASSSWSHTTNSRSTRDMQPGRSVCASPATSGLRVGDRPFLRLPRRADSTCSWPAPNRARLRDRATGRIHYRPQWASACRSASRLRRSALLRATSEA